MLSECAASMWWFPLLFFSSRRRHTRCLSDWSSDVCSSDLWPRMPEPFAAGTTAGAPPGSPRSEERAVGKEWRSRWSPYHLKKKKKEKKRRGKPERDDTTTKRNTREHATR